MEVSYLKEKYKLEQPKIIEGPSHIHKVDIVVNSLLSVFWDVTPCGSCTNRCFGGT
jgi:hypothetical protein